MPLMSLATPPPKPKYPQDMDEATIRLFESVEPFTMTNIVRVFALRQAVQYVAANDIPGDIVECGVWKGGSMMAIAKTLLENHSTSRKLHLFDTFEGMSQPTELDKDQTGAAAAQMLQRGPRETNPDWAYAPLKEVKHAMRLTGYDPGRIVYIKGKVEETLPQHAPQQIALLRLDTDWYESTYHELVHLYPRLCVGGVLIIGASATGNTVSGCYIGTNAAGTAALPNATGVRRAVDQYISEQKLKLLLNRVDYTARICVKAHP